MKAEAFLKSLTTLKDEDLKDALNWSVGRVHPLEEPQKFLNMHKKPLNMEKIIKEAVYNYFMKCTQTSVQKYPKSKDVVKQVTLELELKQKALPKLIKSLKEFYPDALKHISTLQICNLGCSTFGCHRDYGKNPVCDKNFCNKCV